MNDMEDEQNLPSIQVRMQNFTPTSNVVEYYTSKIEKYETHFATLMRKLEEYKLSHEHQLNLEKKVRQVMDQNENLQQSLVSLRVHLLDARKALLQMKAENGRLKLQEVADRKTINHLLTMCGNAGQTATLILNQPLSLNDISNCPVTNQAFNENKCASHEMNFIALQTDNDVLRLHVKALKAELIENATLTLRERDSLILEYEKVVRDFEARKLSDGATIEDLIDRVSKLQLIAYNNLRDTLPLHKTASVPSLNAPKEAKLPINDRQPINSLNKLKNRPLKQQNHVKFNKGEDLSKCNHEDIIKDLENKLMRSENTCKRQEQKLQEMRLELSRVEGQKEHLRDKEDVKDNKHLHERIRYLTAQNKNLERRRKLDLEGFRSDIKLLRDELRDIDKQLLKMVLILGNRKESVNLSTLDVIESTAHGSAQIATRLKDLKSKLTKVQSDL